MPDIDYRYLTVHLRTNKILGDLELRDVRFDNVLSGIGTASGTFFYDRNALDIDELKTATEPGAVALYILRNGVPAWAGIVDKRDRNPENRSVTLNCSTYESYFTRIFQQHTHYFDVTVDDQLSIASWIAGQVNEEPGSQIGIDIPSGQLSGVKRGRTFLAYEFKTLYDELSALAGLIDGFDFNVRPYIDSSGNLRRALEFGYPFLGASSTESQLVWDYPGNVGSVVISEDAKSSATRVYAIGAGDADAQLQYDVTSDKVASNQYPLYETSRSYKSVYSPTTLVAHGQADLQRLLTPVRTFQLDVTGSLWPNVNDYRPGDWAQLNIEDNWELEHKIVHTARIQSYSVTVPGNPSSGEVVSLVFETPKQIQDDGTTVNDGS